MKFEDLELGMITEGEGLIISIIEPGTDPYWGDSRGIEFLPWEHAYDGRHYAPVMDDSEYVELHPIGTKEYDNCIRKILNERGGAMRAAHEDVKILHSYRMANKRIMMVTAD